MEVDQIKKLLEEKNFILSREEYLEIFNPISEENEKKIKYIQYLPYQNRFEAVISDKEISFEEAVVSGEKISFEVKQKCKIK